MRSEPATHQDVHPMRCVRIRFPKREDAGSIAVQLHNRYPTESAFLSRTDNMLCLLFERFRLVIAAADSCVKAVKISHCLYHESWLELNDQLFIV